MPEQARQKKMPNLGEAWKVTALVAVVLFKYIACHSTASILAARNLTALLVTTYPLWTGSTTVDAAVVLICLCDLTQLGAGLRVDLPHFTHRGCVACGLLNVVGMRRRGVLLQYWRERAVEMVGRQRRLGRLGVLYGMLYFWWWMLLVYCHVICL